MQTEATTCDRCNQLQSRLEVLQAERDELMLMLARERQRANAVVLQFPSLPAVIHVPVVTREALPMRYRVADRINDSLKKLLPIAHVAAKRLTAKNG